MPITDIIRVTVSLETAAVIARGFGIPMILGQHTRFGDRFRIYTSPADMLDGGFTTSDPEYLKAQVLVSQARRPSSFVVGRRLAPVARVLTISVDVVADSTLYTFQVDGITVNFTSGVGATATTIRDGLVSAANLALSEQTAAPAGAGTFTITADVAGRSFALTESDPGLSFTETTANVGAQEDLQAILDAGALWYLTLLTSRTSGDILEAAAWTEAAPIQHALLAQTSEAASRDNVYSPSGTDLKSRLRALGYRRTKLEVHHSNTEHLDAALAGGLLPLRPGTETWALKRLVGVTPSPYTATQRSNIRGGNANFYYEVSPGTSISWEGITSGGIWFDQLRLGDAISADISERIFNLQLNSNKIPMTDDGIQLVTDQVTGSLESFERDGALASIPKYAVTRPMLADISPANRAARILDPPITAQAQTSGAIHQAAVDVTITP